MVLHLALRLAASYDGDGEHERNLRRLAVPVAKFWVTKRCPAVAVEALECLGGNGYVEESGLPRLFRESPLNSIWEGSGNVIALDVLRTLGRDPEAVAAVDSELSAAFGSDARYDRALVDYRDLLSELAPERARECLSGQLGRIAGRNSCRAGWTPSLDLQLNFRPDLGGMVGRRLNLMVSLVNPLAGADRLLHGANGLRGWGQPDRPDATLLYVRGFDPSAERFTYEVNERFGDTQSARTAIRSPFQIGLQVRF